MNKLNPLTGLLACTLSLPDAGAQAGPPCRTVNIAIDADTEFTASLFSGDAAAAEAYAQMLVDAVSAIFERDLNITLEPVFIRAWDAEPDPYTATDAAGLLSQVRAEFTIISSAIVRTSTW